MIRAAGILLTVVLCSCGRSEPRWHRPPAPDAAAATCAPARTCEELGFDLVRHRLAPAANVNSDIRIATSSSGFIVAWSGTTWPEPRDTEPSVLLQRFDDRGETVGSAVELRGTRVHTIAEHEDGLVLWGWREYAYSPDGYHRTFIRLEPDLSEVHQSLELQSPNEVGGLTSFRRDGRHWFVQLGGRTRPFVRAASIDGSSEIVEWTRFYEPDVMSSGGGNPGVAVIDGHVVLATGSDPLVLRHFDPVDDRIEDFAIEDTPTPSWRRSDGDPGRTFVVEHDGLLWIGVFLPNQRRIWLRPYTARGVAMAEALEIDWPRGAPWGAAASDGSLIVYGDSTEVAEPSRPRLVPIDLDDHRVGEPWQPDPDWVPDDAHMFVSAVHHDGCRWAAVFTVRPRGENDRSYFTPLTCR